MPRDAVIFRSIAIISCTPAGGTAADLEHFLLGNIGILREEIRLPRIPGLDRINSMKRFVHGLSTLRCARAGFPYI